MVDKPVQGHASPVATGEVVKSNRLRQVWRSVPYLAKNEQRGLFGSAAKMD